MSSICWTGYETKHSIASDIRRRAYLITFFFILWAVNLMLVVLGLPFILAGKLLSRVR
jgi:hypothetical protein